MNQDEGEMAMMARMIHEEIESDAKVIAGRLFGEFTNNSSGVEVNQDEFYQWIRQSSIHGGMVDGKIVEPKDWRHFLLQQLGPDKFIEHYYGAWGMKPPKIDEDYVYGDKKALEAANGRP